MQQSTVSIYRTQDRPIALVAWAASPQVNEGQPIEMAVALENRSTRHLYCDLPLPYGLDNALMPLKIEVWADGQRLPWRGPVIKRAAITDESLTRIEPFSGFAGLFFDLRLLGYQLSKGHYQVVLWYDSSRMQGALVKAKRLWRGRTSQVVVPVEVV